MTSITSRPLSGNGPDFRDLSQYINTTNSDNKTIMYRNNLKGNKPSSGCSRKNQSPTFLRYDANRIENDAYQQVFFAMAVCLPSYYLATMGGFTDWRSDSSVIRQVPYRKRRPKQFSIFAYSPYHGKVSSELLPSNDLREYTYRHTDWWEGFMNYAVEMGSCDMIHIQSFVKIGSGIQKWIKGIHRHIDIVRAWR
jgi:hypothetical protein